MSIKICETDFPRVTLKCRCGNEFVINVMRFKDGKPTYCQICGEEFPKELGLKFEKSLEDLYNVKYQLEREGFPFHFSFIYSSVYTQPPIPYSIKQEQE